MKTKQLRIMPKEELSKKMLELRKELMKENAQVATGTIPKNPGKLKVTKKTIARIKTLLTEKAKQEAQSEQVRSTSSTEAKSEQVRPASSTEVSSKKLRSTSSPEVQKKV